MTTIWVPRTQWAALEPREKYQEMASDLQRGLAVHHSGNRDEQRKNHGDCAGVVRAIQRYHIEARGWADVAYNWLSCVHGYLYEGRGIGHRSAAQGTNAGNSEFHAVCYLGDGARFVASADTVGPLHTARAFVMSRYPAAHRVWPHLRFHATSCPGTALREWCRQFPD